MSEGISDDVVIGEKLRHYREVLGLTQEVLAERSSLSVRTISDIERGRTTRPHSATLRQLASALQLASTLWPNGHSYGTQEKPAMGAAIADSVVGARVADFINQITSSNPQLSAMVVPIDAAAPVPQQHNSSGRQLLLIISIPLLLSWLWHAVTLLG